jgi:hypothetical protein
MVRMAPKTYAKKLNLPVKIVTIQVDTTWWYSSHYHDGWAFPQYTMKGWDHPKKESAKKNGIKGERKVTNHKVSNDASSFYLRHLFDIPGIPVSSEIELDTDSEYQLYVNGNEVQKLLENESRIVTPDLNQGKNVVGLRFPEKEGFSLEGSLKIQYISEQDLSGANKDHE